MSQENVEMMRQLVAAWNRQDLEAMAALADRDIEYVNSPTAVEPGTRNGIEAFRQVLRDQWEILAGARWEIDKFHERGNEVIGLGRLSRRLPGSDDRIGDVVLGAILIENKKVVRMEVLGWGQAEVQKALEAAGLSE